MLTLRDLQLTAKELNEVLTLSPEIDWTAEDPEFLIEEIKSVLHHITPADRFTNETQRVFDEIIGVPKKRPSKSPKSPEAKEENIFESVPKILKEIVMEDNRFDSLRDNVDTLIATRDLSKEMLKILREKNE
jgi:hypothetical protein